MADPDNYQAPEGLVHGQAKQVAIGGTHSLTLSPKPPAAGAEGAGGGGAGAAYEDPRWLVPRTIQIHAADYGILVNGTASTTMDREAAKEEEAEKDDVIYLLPGQPADPAAPLLPDAPIPPEPFSGTVEADIRSAIDLTLYLSAYPRDLPHVQFGVDKFTGKTGSVLSTSLVPLRPSPQEDGTWVAAVEVLTLTGDTEDLTVRSPLLSISSTKANIEPSRHGTPDEPYHCNNPTHVAGGELIIDALTIYHNAVRDEKGKTQPFDVILETKEIANLQWILASGPESGELVDATSSTAIFRNPTRGGLYEFHATIGGSFTFGKLQLWLPVAGPDISQYWTAEIEYIKETWGPAYREDLEGRNDLRLLLSPAIYLAQNEIMAAGDMFNMGASLDWNNPDNKIIVEPATPCGGPTTFWDPYVPAMFIPLQTLTIEGVVISWSKRNNVMYGLIGSEMGLKFASLQAGGNAANLASSGTLDSPEAVNAYKAGRDLYKGKTLADVMAARGLSMHEPDSWAEREWPSHENSDVELVRNGKASLDKFLP